MHNTEFRSHLCFGLCDVSHSFFEPQCTLSLGQIVRDVLPMWGAHMSNCEPGSSPPTVALGV